MLVKKLENKQSSLQSEVCTCGHSKEKHQCTVIVWETSVGRYCTCKKYSQEASPTGVNSDKLKGYLEDELARLEMEIKNMLPSKSANYNMGKIVGRTIQCKQILSKLEPARVVTGS